MNSQVLKFAFSLLLLQTFTSCKKEAVPSVETTQVAEITGITAKSGGNVIDEGSSTVISRGICWSTSSTPTVADNKTSDGAGIGSFTSTMTGLSAAKAYFVRAYATNGQGTGYGMAYSFTTRGQAPISAISPAENITVASATLTGTVNPNYVSTSVVFEYGKTNNYGNTVNALHSPIDGNAPIAVSANINSLEVATTYHYRIKSENSLGITYSNDGSFTTLGLVPSAEISAATDISLKQAQLNGVVNANYLSTDVYFEFGTTLEFGNTIKASQSPVTGNSNIWVSSILDNLQFGTQYYFRIKAVNSLGTTYSNSLTFKTLGMVPTVETLTPTILTSSTAQFNGKVNPNSLQTVISFEYGTSTSYGNTITATESPQSGPYGINIHADIVGLSAGITYHYRVVAVNALGTVYGEDILFTSVFTLGENANGGIIFYLDQTKMHGLAIAPSDLEMAKWGCSGSYLTSAPGGNGVSGSINTKDIIDKCFTIGIAARLCSDLVINGYDDWYLPSLEEMTRLYAKKSLINNLNLQYAYWSSSEFDETRAYTINLGDNRQDYYNKEYEFNVRAIRAF